MKAVLLDTNALLIPHQHKVDIFSEIQRLLGEPYELATMSGVVDELIRLADPGSKDGVAAKVGLRLLHDKAVRVIPSEGHVDREILKFAAENGSYVCTNDGELKSMLRKKGVKVLAMRGKNHLELS